MIHPIYSWANQAVRLLEWLLFSTESWLNFPAIPHGTNGWSDASAETKYSNYPACTAGSKVSASLGIPRVNQDVEVLFKSGTKTTKPQPSATQFYGEKLEVKLMRYNVIYNMHDCKYMYVFIFYYKYIPTCRSIFRASIPMRPDRFFCARSMTERSHFFHLSVL